MMDILREAGYGVVEGPEAVRKKINELGEFSNKEDRKDADTEGRMIFI